MNNRIKQEIDEIQIPKNLRSRSQMGIQKASSEMNKRVRKNKVNTWISGVAAIFIVVPGLLLVSDDRFSHSLKGFFKNSANHQGDITETAYTSVSKDISVQMLKPIASINDVIYPVVVTFQKEDVAPYNVTEEFTLGEFRIIDDLGIEISNQQITIESSVQEEFSAEASDSKNHFLTGQSSEHANEIVWKANLVIGKEVFNVNQKYKLEIHSFTSQNQDDAPVEIKGQWDIVFPQNE